MINAIVAVDENYGIGYQNQLLEHIPGDLKYFKEKTSNSVVIMGRKTYESLPKKPLPNRLNIVITSKANSISSDNGVIYLTLDQAKDFLKENAENQDIYIIGGASIYTQFLPYYDKIYITKIYKTHNNIDTYFPNIEELPNWQLIEHSMIHYYNEIPYQFQVYQKI